MDFEKLSNKDYESLLDSIILNWTDEVGWFEWDKVVKILLSNNDRLIILTQLAEDKIIIQSPGSTNIALYGLTLKGREIKRKPDVYGYVRKEKDRITELRYKRWVNFSLIFGGVSAGIYYLVELIGIIYKLPPHN